MAATPFDLTDRVAVVIGATSGIGRVLATGLAQAGATVVPTGRRQNLVEEVCQELEKTHDQSLPRITCDVKDRSSIDRLRDEVISRFGKVDIVIYAAGVAKKTPSADLKEEEWDDLIDTNLTGALRCCQSFYQPLKASPYARIVLVASMASLIGFHQIVAYSASKSGLRSLAQSLGAEWAKDGIRVNALVPGVFVTDLNRSILEGTDRGREMLGRIPTGRFGDAKELIGAATFLSSDAASYMTGQCLIVDGGYLCSGVNS